MAEGLARHLFGDDVHVQSAGSTPSTVNPLAVAALCEVGIDITAHTSKSVDTIDPNSVDLVITLCAEEVCPAFLGKAQRLHWPLTDPDRKHEVLSDEERLQFFRVARDQLAARLNILQAVHNAPPGLAPHEFHASVRVPDVAAATRLYMWLLGVSPKDWTHRYVTFVSEQLRTNFVLLVDDGKTLHQDTLYHLGVNVGTKDAVIAAEHAARAAGFHVEKPARTTWRGTPLHELWLKDPGGNLVEVYARLTAEQLTTMPASMEPEALT
jgi:protein-tyrosine-phosphatase/extradiol dioxygenase family protein